MGIQSFNDWPIRENMVLDDLVARIRPCSRTRRICMRGMWDGQVVLVCDLLLVLRLPISSVCSLNVSKAVLRGDMV